MMNAVLENTGEKENPAEVQVAKCINCGVMVAGQYCTCCGQRRGVSKISWKSLGKELSEKWLGFDNQLGRTFISLSLRPGKVVSAFLAGNRVNYLGPLGYYAIVTALVLLGFSALEIDIEAFMKASGNSFSTGTEPPKGRIFEVQQQAFHYLSSAFRFMVILFVPFFAVAASLFFRKKGFNYLEHVVMLIYSTGHMFFITLLQAILFKTTGNVYTSVSVLLTLLYYGFFYSHTMSGKFSFKNFSKGIGVVLSGCILFVLLISAVLLAVVVLILK